MKRFFASILIICFLISFSACGKKTENTDGEELPSTTSSAFDIRSDETDASIENENSTSPVSNSTTNKSDNNSATTTVKSHGNGLINDDDMAKLENSEAVTYFSDSPNNKYICMIANKYNVDKSTLVALIKVNAEFPGATVLQFSGKKDADGELLMTEDELKYVYGIDDDSGKITRAARKSSQNDGVNFIESSATFLLTEKYIIPELSDLKENRRYPD